MHHFQNEAVETLQIGGAARQAIRIAHRETGVSANHFDGTWRLWIDVQTGALVRRSFQLVSGDAQPDQDWIATGISVP
jgi:hypothetical protein